MNSKFFVIRRGTSRPAISLIMAWVFAINFLFPLPCLYSQAPLTLPTPGAMVMTSDNFSPILLRGLKVDPANPFRLDFIVDLGDERGGRSFIKDESSQLIKYFFAAVTTPEKDLWVNLSPYEKDRIIPDMFGQTDMGRDLLAQDYILKQLTASLLYPEGDVGRKFWSKVYEEAYKRFGTTDIPVDTFNKVWIVPDKAVVYENDAAAFVVESHLKVMLETDYLAIAKSAASQAASAAMADVKESESSAGQNAETRELSKQMVREVVLPVIEREVNEGRNFARLRQVYQSIILSIWYKKKLKGSILDREYIDKNKIRGIDIADKAVKEKIYAQYLEAFKRGVYNFIKEEQSYFTDDIIPRKYFSGGTTFEDVDAATTFTRSVRGLDTFEDRALGHVGVIAGPVTDAAQERTSFGYIEETWERVNEGDGVVLRAVMNDAKLAKEYDVIIHSNRGGAWQDGEHLAFVRIKNGKAIFETTIKADQTFQYTFVFQRKSDKRREWADLPYGNGTVLVDRDFKGRVVFAGSEFAPLVKKGGQGDVMYELPRNLVKAGVDVTVVLPFYKKYAEEYAKKGYVIEDVPGVEINIPFKRRASETLKVKKTTIDGITVYLLDASSPDLFAEPYTSAEFYESILLSQGVPALLERLGKPVDILQYNDHHAALVPLYMQQKHAAFFAKTGRVFTIHNIGYQGQYWDQRLLEELGLEQTDALRRLVIKSGQLNFMAVPPGVAKAEGYKGHYVGTVSPTYAKEIRKTRFEMDMLLQDMGDAFDGIMNGIDMEVNNPATDEILLKISERADLQPLKSALEAEGLALGNYSIEDERGIEGVVAAKGGFKRVLQQALGEDQPLPEWESNKGIEKSGSLTVSDRLLVGTVGRNVKQKQIDILADIVDDIVNGRRPRLNFDLILAGPANKDTDDQDSVRRLKELARLARERNTGINIVILDGFVNELGYAMYAGLDLLLMPSDFEPAGISQQLAKRYGTVPLVRKTGGLADTVFEGGPDDNGFVFNGTFRRMAPGEDWQARRQNADEFYDKLRQAVDVFENNKTLWRKKMENGMRDDSSWTRRQKDYLNVYAGLQDQLSDKAQVNPTGGIDFTPGGWDVETRGSTADVQKLWATDSLDNIKISGLNPTVVSVEALLDFSGFMGLPKDAKGIPEVAGLSNVPAAVSH